MDDSARDDLDDPRFEDPRAPRIGQLTLRDAAICAVGLRTLAQRLALGRGAWDLVSICARAATWLDRQLQAIDEERLLTSPDRWASDVLLPVPDQLRAMAWELNDLAEVLPNYLDDYGDLDEVCWLLAAAGDIPPGRRSPVLRLGLTAMQRGDAYYAAQCFDQLRSADDPEARLTALYEGARARAHLEEWSAAATNLRALAAEPDRDLVTEVTKLQRPQLMAYLAEIEQNREHEQRSTNNPGDLPGFSGLD